MMSSLALYQEIENAFDFVDKPSIPKVITDNIKQALRPYQINALENFIFYNTSKKYKDISNKHLLFHMATGSGKTNIIAATILYLYEQGYRDFIFFVNTQNIITKTKANLIDKYSSKYLFKDTMKIDINEIVDNFDSSKSSCINIMFTTINKLHGDLELLIKENSISYADFENRKIALIADEAHHLNSEFKTGKATKTEEENNRSWSTTKNNILKCHKDNILLEFTATAEINNNPAIKEHYKDKIIAEYPLIQFREDKYSKDIRLVSDGLTQEQRILQAILVSEYRQMVAERDLNLNIKPVILFKNKTKDDTDSNFEKFLKQIDKLAISDIEEIFKLSQVAAIKNLHEIVKDDLNIFVTRLKRSFDKDKCLAIYNSSNSKEEKLKLLNSLENSNNPIRVIFAINVLNEGWDVLNLYDIVKLDEAKTTPTATTAEAQLIGRGARYYPFTYNQEDIYKRKFDSDLNNPLRVLEEMYFYSINDNKYIKSLKESLRKEGLADDTEDENIVEFKIKESFIKDELYQSGYVYINEQLPIDKKQDIQGLEFYSKKYKNFTIQIDNSNNNILILDDTNFLDTDTSFDNHEPISIKDNLDIFRLAINKKPFFYFSNLKKYLPNLNSISMLCSDSNYLGSVELTISSSKKMAISNNLMLEAFCKYLDFLQNEVEKNSRQYKGTKEFKPVRISDRLKNKAIKAKDSDKTITQDSQWYVFESHKGTSEEHSFVNFVSQNISKLEDFYSDIKLIRNEKAFEIYAFDGANNGDRFEPDFILLVKCKKDGFYYQIFCEPKGEHLLEKDKWKEELLNGITKLTNDGKLKLKDPEQLNLQINETKHYKIYGLPFYNASKQDEFNNSFKNLLLD